VQEAFAQNGVRSSEARLSDAETSYATLLGLAQASWLCLNAERAISVAVSPSGHISAVSLFSNEAG
jgi:hypothetical protein